MCRDCKVYVICTIGALYWIWLIIFGVLCVCFVCANLNTGYLFTVKLKYEEYELASWDPRTWTWHLGPIWLVDLFYITKKLKLSSGKGHGPKMRRLNCWAWPIYLGKTNMIKNTNRPNCWARPMYKIELDRAESCATSDCHAGCLRGLGRLLVTKTPQ